MKRSLRNPRRHARGGAAVELAVLLPVIIVMLTVPLFFGRVFWHYTVAEKAAHDAARFLAAASAAEIATPGQAGGDAPLATAAKAIVQAEIAELHPGPYAPSIEVLCDGDECFGFEVPKTITVRVTLPLYDEFFEGFTDEFTGGRILLKAVATTKYVGN
jgi:hypothetical protein